MGIDLAAGVCSEFRVSICFSMSYETKLGHSFVHSVFFMHNNINTL